MWACSSLDEVNCQRWQCQKLQGVQRCQAPRVISGLTVIIGPLFNRPLGAVILQDVWVLLPELFSYDVTVVLLHPPPAAGHQHVFLFFVRELQAFRDGFILLRVKWWGRRSQLYIFGKDLSDLYISALAAWPDHSKCWVRKEARGNLL